jgi:hypothetical protein
MPNRYSIGVLVFLASITFLTACASSQYGGVREFDVVTTPSGAEVYLIPRYDAEQQGWIGMRGASLVAEAGALSSYHQGQAPLRVQGNEQTYLLVAIHGSRAASRLVQPQPGQTIQIVLSQ